MSQPDNLPPSSASRGRILLVDDDEIVRTVGVEVLEDLGYSVQTAKNGREAVSIFAQSPDTFDVVIVDLLMHGQSGPETFHQLRKINPDCRIIICTGSASDNSIDTLFTQGLAGFLRKPYRPDELESILNTVLQR
jgi:two-component system cell cycle sensor histidine kinase/response regulator CckA